MTVLGGGILRLALLRGAPTTSPDNLVLSVECETLYHVLSNCAGNCNAWKEFLKLQLN